MGMNFRGLGFRVQVSLCMVSWLLEVQGGAPSLHQLSLNPKP